VDGAVENGWKRNLQLLECVLEEIEKALGVQKKWCPCSSRCWHFGGARGSRGGDRAGALRRGGRTGRPARGREGGGEAVNGMWARREIGGDAGDAATASGGEVQLGQEAGGVARQGEASARAESGGASGGAARGSDLGSVEAAGQRTWPGSGSGVR
jgi:hypothetical protein